MNSQKSSKKEKDLRNEHQIKWLVHEYLWAVYNGSEFLLILTKNMCKLNNLHKIFMIVIYISSFQSLLYDYTLQFSSVAQSCPTLCNPMNRSTPGLPVHHQLLEFTQTHVHWVRDAIQPSRPRSSPSPPVPSPSQHQSLFQWVNSSHEVAKVLEVQL